MTHDELVLVALSVHAPTLLTAIAAYYKYGDRTELFTKSLQGADSLVRRMRQQIGLELEEKLRPLFERPGAMPPPVIGEEGNTYIELPVNPVGSERYREAVCDFIEVSSGAITDLRSLVLCKEAWCSWAKFLSWAILGLLSWQLAVVGGLAFVDRIGGVPLPDWSIKWSALPTSLGVLTCLFPIPQLLCKHDRMNDFRARYDRL